MLKIQDTLSKQLKEFKPQNDNVVTFYHCGPTVYWTQHIGNMRAMIMGDLIKRSLTYLGYNVKFARNYTDVGHLTGDNLGDADTGEDRMEKASKKEGIDPNKIADKYIEQFEKDLSLLNHSEVEYKLRATEHIDSMISVIQTLLDKNYAYTTSKAVYFDVSKKEDYTKLSGQKLEFNKQGAGAGDVNDPEKQSPHDFALWFFKTGVHKNALQTWESPFTSPEVENGEGFPGWHIECSAMSMEVLGKTLDIHMGGIEHIPIHHTNEIAQSESANGVPFANYWLHNEHLTIDGGKMSKSLGNVYSVEDIMNRGYDPLVLRYFFLNSHYRSKQNFTWEALGAANNAYHRLAHRFYETVNPENGQISKPHKSKFISALENDFNIPQALAIAWDTLKAAIPDQDKYITLLDFDRVLGLNLDKQKTIEISEELQTLLNQRQGARDNKEWQKSDEIRDRIKEQFGVIVKDTAEGQIIA